MSRIQTIPGLGRRVRAAREALELSQAALSRRAGLGMNAVVNAENLDAASPRTLEKLSAALELELPAEAG